MNNQLVLNGAFLAQRVTGQQRYANEISRRLLSQPQVSLASPPARLRNSRIAMWLWAQRPLHLDRDQYLLSLTSRSPVFSRRHVVVIHDLFLLMHPEWYSSSYVRTHAPVFRWQLDHARAFVAVSEPTFHELARYRGSTDDIALAPNGVERLNFGSSSEADLTVSVLRRLGLASGTYFLTVGSSDPRKNFRLLSEAYGSLPSRTRREHPLVIVGGESEVFRREAFRWPEGAVVTGYLSDSELGVLYKSARAVVIPSIAEGFGLPVVEASVCEASLLISDIPVFRWIYGDGATYFDPFQVDSLVDALESAVLGNFLLGPTELAVKSCEIATRFSWAESAERILAFVQSLDR